MPEIGEVVRLKSGGPDMVITYVYQENEGSREKLALMKGFGPGDIACEWQQVINEENIRTKKESFKAATVVYLDGRPVS
ncbi:MULTISPECIES: DUF2158 domain-containing protein [unclassified Aureispira]|uniref:DUF2158 domain-containing protein n=1 Tax=unclassified Aureispira TaxID=2649989 RepID=UPI000697D388|nr:MULTISPECIES: DUF2158 domain-containing protein [unclassified Aureispira]WMX13460.1 DUF2158 domain-containing protein [Aureispira sp. CCB-E]